MKRAETQEGQSHDAGDAERVETCGGAIHIYRIAHILTACLAVCVYAYVHYTVRCRYVGYVRTLEKLKRNGEMRHRQELASRRADAPRINIFISSLRLRRTRILMYSSGPQYRRSSIPNRVRRRRSQSSCVVVVDVAVAPVEAASVVVAQIAIHNQ